MNDGDTQSLHLSAPNLLTVAFTPFFGSEQATPSVAIFMEITSSATSACVSGSEFSWSFKTMTRSSGPSGHIITPPQVPAHVTSFYPQRVPLSPPPPTHHWWCWRAQGLVNASTQISHGTTNIIIAKRRCNGTPTAPIMQLTFLNLGKSQGLAHSEYNG